MKHKKLIIGCSAAFAVFVVLVGVAGWLFYSKFIRPYRTETPAELREPRIITGADFLARAQLLKINESVLAGRGRSIGSINDFAIKENNERSPIEIVIAGKYGAMIVDQDGTNKAQVQYQFQTENEKIGIFNR